MSTWPFASKAPWPRGSRGALALAALLLVPSSTRGVEAHEVLRYKLFSGRKVGQQALAAAAGDGHVLVAWTDWVPEQQRLAPRVRWLAPDGTPLGPSFELEGDGYLVALAARPGREALLVSPSSGPGHRLTLVDASGVVRWVETAGFGCRDPHALTATEAGYFLACFETLPARFSGWWVSAAGRPLQRVEIGVGSALALAGGRARSVLALFGEDDGGLRARWLTPRGSGPEVLVDERWAYATGASAAHLGDGAFGIAWVREHERIPNAEDDVVRITAVHAATVRAPGAVRSVRRFSGLSGSVEAPVGEQRRPHVLPTAAGEQVLAWFGCGYGSSPAGLICNERDGLVLRGRAGGGAVGGPVELAGVARGSVVVHTGERLLAFRLIYRYEDDLYDLEVASFVLE